MAVQLGLDGRETPYPLSPAPWLTDKQRAVLRLVRSRETVRTLEVGNMMHAARPNGCIGGGRGFACCDHSSADGWYALKRLEARGLVEHVARGTWRATPPTAERWSATQRVTPDEVAEIVRLYVEEGLTQAEVARRVFRHCSTVCVVLKRAGIPARPRHNRHRTMAVEDALEIVAMYGRGYSAQEVADIFGVSREYVTRRVRRFGRGGMRGLSEAQRLSQAHRKRSAVQGAG